MLKRIAFVVLAIAIFFGAGEIVFRAIGLNILSGDVGHHNRPFYFEMAKGDQNIDMNLVLGVKVFPLVPKNYRIPKPVKPKADGTFRILCLGDSSTIGDGVEAEQTYCAQLEKLLSEKLAPRAVESINAGFYGYSSYQGRKLFESYKKILCPDAVVYYFGANDAVFAPLREDKEWEEVPRWAYRTKAFLYQYIRFYRFLRNVNVRYALQALVHPFNEEARQLPSRSRVRNKDFLQNLEAVERMAQESGGSVYVVPYLSLNGPRIIHAAYFEHFRHDRMIDLEPAFVRMIEQGRTPFVDGVHPNPEGHRIIAELLAERISADLALSDEKGLAP